MAINSITIGGISPHVNNYGQVRKHDSEADEVEKSQTIKNSETNKDLTQNKTISEKEEGLSEEEKRVIEQLKAADTKVRAHEMAHVAAGGQYTTSGANFSYKRGPDGKNYAVAGEVGIDISKVPGDPEATAKKMDVVKRSALAPMDPSPQDRRIAAQATMIRMEALMELTLLETRKKTLEEQETGNRGYISGFTPYSRDNDINETGMTINIIG